MMCQRSSNFQGNTSKPVLFDYWRSSASYRVRIALNLAKISFETVSVDLAVGAQNTREHLNRNPQGFVPVLDIDGHRLTQSLGIVEYLDTTRQLNLWPKGPARRAKVNGVVGSVAIDTHPICNLSVARYARGRDRAGKSAWMKHFIGKGLHATEALLDGFPKSVYAAGDHPGVIDICLVPQVYNARRWQLDMSVFPRISEIVETCGNHPAFAEAAPVAPQT